MRLATVSRAKGLFPARPSRAASEQRSNHFLYTTVARWKIKKKESREFSEEKRREKNKEFDVNEKEQKLHFSMCGRVVHLILSGIRYE